MFAPQELTLRDWQGQQESMKEETAAVVYGRMVGLM